jgi:hypothetical protein
MPFSDDGDDDAADALDNPLPDEVRTADLTTYERKQLEGRKTYYEREALFERDHATRLALREEAERTTIELNRRKMYERAEADRVFAL